MTFLAALKQGLAYRWARPLVQATPETLWDAACRGLAWASAPWTARRHRASLDAILRATGRETSGAARRALARAFGHARLRRLDFYLRDGCGTLTWDWQGGGPTTEPCCYVLLDTPGAEHITTIGQHHPIWIVRQSYGGEGQLDPATCPPGQRWTAHGAWLRHRVCQGCVADVSLGLRALRPVFDEPRHLVVFQGNLGKGRPVDRRRVLDREVLMPLGSVTLAHRLGMRLRFVRVLPVARGWRFVIEPPMACDEAALVARIERELRDRPEGWLLWPGYLEAPTSGAGSLDDAQPISSCAAAAD